MKQKFVINYLSEEPVMFRMTPFKNKNMIISQKLHHIFVLSLLFLNLFAT
jgi:hypothetical protein